MAYGPPYGPSYPYYPGWWMPVYPYPYPAPTLPVGWSCPKCGRVWAPGVSSCNCHQTHITWSGTGTYTTTNVDPTSYTISYSNVDPDDPPDDHVGAPV